jgi:hypothetical protein
VFLERRLASTGGGVFVIEAFVPDMTRWDPNQRIETSHIGDDSVVLDAARHDPVEQRVASSHLVVSREGVRLSCAAALRVALVALDLMARMAGLLACAGAGEAGAGSRSRPRAPGTSRSTNYQIEPALWPASITSAT